MIVRAPLSLPGAPLDRHLDGHMARHEGPTFGERLLSAPAAGGPATGDRAFADVLHTSGRKLASLAYAMVGDRTEAEDIVADAFAKVWITAQRRTIDDLDRYLHRTVVNLCIARHRRRALERRERESRRLDWRTPSDAGATFDQAIADQGELRAALLRLPVKQRSVVVLRLVSDLPEGEVAALLGVSVGTVKSRLARGLATLRAHVPGGGQ